MNPKRERRLRLAHVGAALAILTACGRSPAQPPDRNVTIGMRYSKFTPAAITVRAGTTVHFKLRNDDPIPHEFILGDEQEQQRHEHGHDESHDGKPGAASLGANESDSVTFTFAKTGTVIFGCHKPGHYAYGMKGVVRVTS